MLIKIIFLACLSLGDLSLSLGQGIYRGARPEVTHRYQSSKFKCFDGLKTIGSGSINDNYCDCHDGSDEPGTSACQNGQFYCTNHGFEPRILNSSFVDDGFCDCCDGSDEALGRCNNTCYSLGALKKSELLSELEVLLEGLERREELVKVAKNKKIEWIERLVTLHTDTIKWEKKIKKIESRVEAIKGRLSVESRDLLEADDTKVEDSKYVEGVVEDIVENDASGQEAYVNVEVDPEEQARRVALQWTKDPVALGSNNVEFAESTISAGESDFKERIQYFDNVSKLWRRVKDFFFIVGDNIEALEEELERLKKSLQIANSEEEMIREYLKMDLGPNVILLSLLDRCFSTTAEKRYTYEICPLKSATQKVVGSSEQNSLGDWDRYDDDSKSMFFHNGLKCWNGPQRSIKVRLECGVNEVLTSVIEVSRCEYTAILSTPIACLREDHDSIVNQLNVLA